MSFIGRLSASRFLHVTLHAMICVPGDAHLDRGNAVMLRLSGEVAAALADGQPVVALETTLISHGFSAGRGVEAAVESERRVREAGAVPATVGVLDGAIRVGLDRGELDRFAAAAWRSTGR